MTLLRLSLIVLALYAARGLQAQPPPSWIPLSAGANGLSTPVASDMDAAGNLYAIQYAPNSFAPELVRWNGMQWAPLPGTFPLYMNHLAVTDAGDALYIATLASETVADGSGATTTIDRIARYHIPTATWDNLSGGLDNNVQALDTDGAGNLIAGGWFTQASGGMPLGYIARWNQTAGQWEALGGGVSGQVDALAVEPGGNVIAGGRFTETFDTPGGTGQASGGIARFDVASGQWRALGNGFDSVPAIRSITSDGTDVLVTGFIRVGGVARPVYRWSGAGWVPHAAIGEVSINPLQIARDGTGTVYVRGFTSSTTIQSGQLVHARALGAGSWTLVASAPSGANAFRTIATNPNRPGTDLFLGGLFSGLNTPAGGVNAFNFARWNGSVWSNFQPPFIGVNGTVYAAEELLVFEPGTIPVPGPPRSVTRTVIVGGDITSIENTPVAGVAINDGTGWASLGQGVTDPAGVVRTIMEAPTLAPEAYSFNAPATMPLVIGGTFREVTNTDGSVVPVSNVARWRFDTDTWQALGQGVSVGGVPGTGAVHALAHVPASGECPTYPARDYIYVGGEFDTAINADGTTLQVRNLARYNLRTGAWERVEGGAAGPVYALDLLPYPDFATPNASGGLLDHTLYVGGQFAEVYDEAGAPVADTQNLAWLSADGEWRGIGRGASGSVFALEAVTQSALGGRSRFTRRCGELLRASVYVGGAFTSVVSQGATVPVSNLARADLTGFGVTWQVLGAPFGQASGTPGNGVNGTVRSIRAVGPLTASGRSGYTTLTVGGTFTEAYDSYERTIAAPNVVRLKDIGPGRYRTEAVAEYEAIGGGTDGPVEDVAWTSCLQLSGDRTSTFYVGGAFGTVGTGVTSPGLAKWRSYENLYPTRVTHVARTRSTSSCAPGTCHSAVSYVPVWRVACAGPALGFTARGQGDDRVDLGAGLFGETVVTTGTGPLADVPLAFEVRDTDGVLVGVDTLTVDTSSPVALVVSGVDDPSQFAPNPDGRDISVSVRPVQLELPAVRPDALVRFFHAVTDAPALDVTLPDGTILADSLVFDSLDVAVALPLGESTVEVRRDSDGALLATLRMNLPADDAVQIGVLAGFLDPTANQDGPPLQLVQVSLSERAPVSATELPDRPVYTLTVAPNPAPEAAMIRVDVPLAGDVTVEVFDALGRRMAVLLDGPLAAGAHAFRWEARGLASGVYVVRLRAGDVRAMKRVTLVR